LPAQLDDQSSLTKGDPAGGGQILAADDGVEAPAGDRDSRFDGGSRLSLGLLHGTQHLGGTGRTLCSCATAGNDRYGLTRIEQHDARELRVCRRDAYLTSSEGDHRGGKIARL